MVRSLALTSDRDHENIWARAYTSGLNTRTRRARTRRYWTSVFSEVGPFSRMLREVLSIRGHAAEADAGAGPGAPVSRVGA